jgi:23S rRNA pseudouridine1911/1915/1917 synthase
MSNLEISRAERLDMRVIAMLPALTRSAAAQLITDGKVSVSGSIVTKAGYKLKAGDDIQIDYDEQRLVIPEIELPILYEDDDCVVLEKPIGVLTHSKGAFNPEPTVASWLGAHLSKNPKNLFELEAEVATGSPNNPRAGIVHRLDRATSGVIICAKSPAALSFLQKQFSLRKAKKTYIAIVAGKLKADHAIIDMPIERNPKAPATFRVGPNGKASITEYSVEQESEHYSLLKLTPQTGRTHQLRVHLANLGHPIVGDTLYKGESAERLYLHALSLEITVPSRKRLTFASPLPSDFTHKMEQDNA